MHFSGRYIRIHVANLRIVPKVQTRIRSDVSNFCVQSRSLGNLDQFTCTSRNKTRNRAAFHRVIDAVRDFSAIIQIIIHLFNPTAKSVTEDGSRETVIFPFIHYQIDTSIYRCFDERLLHVFTIYVCVCQGLCVV